MNTHRLWIITKDDAFYFRDEKLELTIEIAKTVDAIKSYSLSNFRFIRIKRQLNDLAIPLSSISIFKSTDDGLNEFFEEFLDRNGIYYKISADNAFVFGD